MLQMFEVGTTESVALTAIRTMGATVTLVPKDLLTLTAGNGPYNAANGLYTYPGSLTTPDCNEVVTWIVLPKALTVTEETLKAFYEIKDPSGV